MVESFDESGYVPILLAKQGERMALEQCPDTVVDGLRPLFVVPAPDWDYENNKPKKTVADHISKLPSQLVRTWGDGDAFLDASALGDGDVFGGVHPLMWLVDNAGALGLSLTPVVLAESSNAYVLAAAAAAARTGDACIRLTADHWLAGGPSDPIDELLDELQLDPPDVHIVLDMGDDVGSFAGKAALAELRTFPYVNDWASLTLAATGLPPAMPAGGSTIHTLPRHEWKIYKAICGSTPPRIPTFGDYGVNGPGVGLDIDPKILSIAATLRYTTDTDWLVSKGRLFKAAGGRGIGGGAVPPAAQALMDHADYFGSGHCDFEEWLEAAAAGGPSGNASTWRRYGTLHHLQVVTDQIASLHGP